MDAKPMNYNGHPVVGFGEQAITTPVPPTGPSAWTVAIVTSVVGGATSWVVEEIAKKVRKR